MIKWVRMRKFFVFAFILALEFFALGGGVFAQIKLEDKSDATTQKVEVTFEKQQDIDNFVSGIRECVIGTVEMEKLKIQHHVHPRALELLYDQFENYFFDAICEQLTAKNMELGKKLCAIFANKFPNNFTSTCDHKATTFTAYKKKLEALSQELQDFIKEYFEGAFIFPYKVTFSA